MGTSAIGGRWHMPGTPCAWGRSLGLCLHNGPYMWGSPPGAAPLCPRFPFLGRCGCPVVGGGGGGTVVFDVSGVCGSGVPGSCTLRDGETSSDGTFEVPYVDADSVRGVCVLLSGGGVGARCLLLSASVSAWVAYLYSLTG